MNTKRVKINEHFLEAIDESNVTRPLDLRPFLAVSALDTLPIHVATLERPH